ncbi:CRISPR-associated endonuclease/helicase Cas3 [Desulfomicrobium norvegicum]|uniref:CRISPR-associated endonuclease/helicase Cas3 n=2 Tax=Desulfomicrobium norvegicum (strain DSM 1741 / NCIMB 8310) TaxID=52561 RepID=A0A8G2C433_DESNO|nr:CRISPR-associated endonuclease/helicase Cas3 [Desulfomicrobium norvegicum]
MKYYAHSENNDGSKHDLSKHLFETAQKAEALACRKEYSQFFRLAGLLHDFGKYQPAFQDYLEHGGRRGSIPHAKWGAGYARKFKIYDVSIAIDGHHKGLPNRADWKNDTNQIVYDDEPDFDEVKNAFLVDTGFDEMTLEYVCAPALNGLQHEIFIRYLFSVLTDSDWLSTEKHFDDIKSSMRPIRTLPIVAMLNRLEEEFSAKSKSGEINQLRNLARNEAIGKALLATGFYSLALPTGMGKTLTSLAWALRHAQHNKLKRIIIVLPYISIIDQTARELKRIFGDEWILEHHSSYNEASNSTTDRSEDYPAEQKRKQLACENWDYPIIITTTVQFFESLFSNRPSKCRKIHNIAESVVIFDEVQTIPKEIVLPTLGMLNDIQEIMRTSFLFCTATQPAYEKRPGFDGITAITPLIESPGILYDKSKRVTYQLLDELTPISFARLKDTVTKHDEASLVIFNTKKDALEYFMIMKSNKTWDAQYHLSTAMCPDHRKKTIRNIKSDLKAKKKILVVSTQLIEAGVDFDFPLVFRALAPLEAIIQSAGRCNREGLLNHSGKLGNVYLFLLQDARYPNKTYHACAGYAAELLQDDIEQLYSHNVFEKYYASVFALYIDQASQQGIINARKDFNFETVNDIYRYLDDHSEGLFVYNYNDESRDLLHTLQFKEYISRDDYRAMQPFTVQAYENFIYQNREDVKTSPHGFKIWYGNYDPATGISVDPMEADKYVV